MLLTMAEVLASMVEVICHTVGYFSTVKQAGHVHTAGFRHAPQIVPHHIHDHYVLGLLLVRGPQRLGLRLVLGLGQPPGGGALHRAAGDVVAVQPEEQLRRSAADDPFASVHERAVGRLLRRHQVQEKVPRLGGQRCAEPVGVVDLVSVAAANQGLNALEIALELRNPTEGCQSALSGAGPGRGWQVHLLRAVIQAEPEQRESAAAFYGQRRVEGRGGFVGNEPRRVEATWATACSTRSKPGRNVRQSERGDNLARVRELEPASAGGIAHQHPRRVRDIPACDHSICVAERLPTDKVPASCLLVKPRA